MRGVPDEVAATREPGGPGTPADTSWLILQRLGDLKEGQTRLEGRMDRLEVKVEAQMGELRHEIGGLRQEIGGLRQEFDAKLTRTSNSQLLVGMLGFLGVIATLVAVLVKVG
jgi:hypothetical protein